MDTGDQEFENMIQSPQFQKLGTLPNGKALQMQAVTEFKQQKRMITPKPEGFLQNALKTVGGLAHDVNVGTRAMVNTATFGGADLVDKILPLPQGTPEALTSTPERSPGHGIGGFMSMVTNPVKYHENIIERLGDTAGFVAGGPGQIYQGIEKAVAGQAPNILKMAGARALAGGASGFSAPGDLGQRATQAGVGAVLAPVLGAGFDIGKGAIQKTGKFISDLKGSEIPTVKGKIASAEGDIVTSQQKINDLVKLGPGKIKAKAQEVYRGFQKDFGEGLGNLKWNMNGGQFEEAFHNTARELGGFQQPGSPGARMMEMADAFKDQRLKAFSPQEVQEMVKRFTSGMDQNSAIKFYRQFGEVLSRDYPEFAQLKASYAPVFDILESAKIPNKGVFGEVASDKIGPEGLARAAEAEQVVGVEPSLLGETSEQGARLRGRTEEVKALKNQLSEMMKAQGGAKKRLQDLAWQTAATALPIGGGLIAVKKFFGK